MLRNRCNVESSLLLCVNDTHPLQCRVKSPVGRKCYATAGVSSQSTVVRKCYATVAVPGRGGGDARHAARIFDVIH
jgi:hypothetical protein